MKVLIATDGSRFAQAALDSVAEREWADDTQFLVLHVVQPLPATYIGLSHSFGDVSAMVHEAGRTFGEQMVSKAVAQLTDTCGTNIAGLVTAGNFQPMTAPAGLVHGTKPRSPANTFSSASE